ncbi:MAG: hypothetical protein BRD55_05590 [Bacteroidetes bacterium SW_9_63_38]|nr:MAG: hypothetical protein BRD55_05590 [Bacteroidetes bacterium SW_9_63_38]
MNVAVYSKPFFPNMGGLEKNTLTLCLALGDLGHSVTLITETTAETGEDDRYPFQLVRSESARQIFRGIREADLLITNGGNIPLRSTLLGRLRGVSHGAIYHGFRGFETKGASAVRRATNALRRRLAQRASFNVFTGTHSKTETDVPEATAHVLLNPVDKWTQKFYTETSGRNEDGSPFLFAGRLIEGKGIFVLADALKRLDGSLSLHLIVAGEGRHESDFREQVNSLDSIKVTFAGRLTARDLVPLYERARALIVPSTTHKEGNPLVIAEALFAGTPVIASDQPPMIESVGDAGIIVEQGDVAELADAIRRLGTDEACYRRVTGQAEERAELFSYERYRGKLATVLHSSLSVNGP